MTYTTCSNTQNINTQHTNPQQRGGGDRAGGAVRLAGLGGLRAPAAQGGGGEGAGGHAPGARYALFCGLWLLWLRLRLCCCWMNVVCEIVHIYVMEYHQWVGVNARAPHLLFIKLTVHYFPPTHTHKRAAGRAVDQRARDGGGIIGAQPRFLLQRQQRWWW